MWLFWGVRVVKNETISLLPSVLFSLSSFTQLSSLKLSFADFNSTTIWYLWLITLCGFPLYIISLNLLHAHRHLGKSERHDWNHQTLCILAIYLIISIECWTLYWTGNSNKWFIIPAKNERLKDQSIVLYWRKEVLPFMKNRFVRIEKYTQIQNFVNTKIKMTKTPIDKLVSIICWMPHFA